MSGTPKVINSNVTGVAVAEELSVKVLPGAPVWRGRPVNAYSDLGGDVTLVAAEPISPSRQNQRGTAADLDAGGGYSLDVSNALTRDMQGFFFADAHEKTDTQPLNGVAVPITSVTAGGIYQAASGLTFVAGQLVRAHDFTTPANNGAFLVTAATATTVTTNNAGSTAEAAPPAASKLQQVGLEFAAGDLSLVHTTANVTLTSTASAWININLQVGEWVFIGGDDAGQQYGVGYGYGRVKSKDNSTVVLDNIAWVGTIASDAGAGKTIRVYAGTFIRNEKSTASIKCRTYQVERQLGSDANGVQSEYLTGAVKNELALNIPLTDKHTADFTYVALDNETRTGLEGLKSGTRTELEKQAPYNTSSSVFRMRMALGDVETLTPVTMFGYASEVTLSVTNNATAIKAIGTFGGFDINVGNFVATGSITAYFTTIESIRAIRNNTDANLDVILAQDNKGLVYDVPLLGMSGGRLNVEKDTPITIPIDTSGAENAAGYTMSYTSFDYLPTVAMPV